MAPLRVLLAAVIAVATPATLEAQASASLQVQATVVQPPTFVTASAATGAGLGLRLIGSPNCAVSAEIDGTTLPMGPCAPVGVLTAAAQQTVGRLAKAGRAVVVTMTIDAGT